MLSWRQSLSAIEKTWKKVYPDDTFNYRFFDSTIAAFYEKEERLSKLLRYAMVLAGAFAVCIALGTISYHAIKAALSNAVDSIRAE